MKKLGAAHDGPLHIKSIVNIGLYAGSDFDTVGTGKSDL